MGSYHVYYHEKVLNRVYIEANSEEEARDKFESGEGTCEKCVEILDTEITEVVDLDNRKGI